MRHALVDVANCGFVYASPAGTLTKRTTRITLSEMNLNGKQKRELRARAHALKPVVVVGSGGVTERLLEEVDRALEHHGLIKVRVAAPSREERITMTEHICHACHAICVQTIGHIAVLFREDQPET